MRDNLIHFKVFYPGDIFYRDAYAHSEKKLREDLRDEYKVKRLPNGIWIEPYNPIAAQHIIDNNRRMVRGTSLMMTDLY